MVYPRAFNMHMWVEHKCVGVTEAQADALRMMRKHGGYVSVKVVQKRMGVPVPLDAVLNKLISMGLAKHIRVRVYLVEGLPKLYVQEDYVRVVKRGESYYVCPVCDRLYRSDISFAWHMGKHGFLALRKEEEKFLDAMMFEGVRVMDLIDMSHDKATVFISKLMDFGIIKVVNGERSRMDYTLDFRGKKVVRVEDFKVKFEKTMRVEKAVEAVKVPVNF